MERSYIMLKPEALRRQLAGKILQRIEDKGYRIADIRQMHLTQELLRAHYSHLLDKPFYGELEAHMMSGPVWGMIVEGEDVIRGMRILMGATRFEEALPGTIRGDFAISTTENIIHGSDGPETAEQEIQRFFGQAT